MPQARQIEIRDLRNRVLRARGLKECVDLSEQEIGSECYGHPMPMDETQEQQWIAEHCSGFNMELLSTHVLRHHMNFQECRNVIECYPGQCDIGGGHLLAFCLTHHRGDEVGVAQHNRFRVSCRAGGEHEN